MAVNKIFLRFNGVAWEEYYFYAYDSAKLGGNLPSYYATHYSTVITVAANQSYTITHNLDTQSISVSLIDTTTNAFVETDITVLNNNQISVSLGDLDDSMDIRVVVIA